MPAVDGTATNPMSGMPLNPISDKGHNATNLISDKRNKATDIITGKLHKNIYCVTVFNVHKLKNSAINAAKSHLIKV